MHGPAELELFVARLESTGVLYMVTGATAAIVYVVLGKLEFYREGGSAKHPTDIRAICDVTGVDQSELTPWIDRLGLAEVWRDIGG